MEKENLSNVENFDRKEKKYIYKYESKDFKKLFSLILLFLILKIIILKIGLLKITYTYIIIQEILRRFFWKCFAKSQSIIRDNFETNNYVFIYHEKKWENFLDYLILKLK